MMNYQYLKNSVTGEIRTDYIKKIDGTGDLIFVPTDPTNTDYQVYLDWLAQGNKPLEAE
jgi:hypothetical protein